ncbi:glycine--tRNA ligase subunit beta [Candidatus Zinderia endosymbiont of Aphrophora alni]|uniref:glycine--tRNA ligase subunit beta n=1 Tax=Candidatus Zinderia endosymbiont of Aphrophora alni TaxID=3077951 RepID=UPI0030CE4F6D
MIKKNLLIELMTEELPHKILLNIENTFTKNIIYKLQLENFIKKNSYIETYSTIRRIGIYIKNVKKKSKSLIFKKKILSKNIAFDKNNRPTFFLIKKISIISKINNFYKISINKIKKKNKNNKKELFFYYKKKNIYLKYFLKNVLENSIKKLSIYRFMKYNKKINKNFIKIIEFIRPIKNLLIIFGKKIISLNILHINSNSITYGNRFIKNNILNINNANNYSKILIKEGKVIPNFSQRLLTIKNLLFKKAKNYKLSINKKLLKEITALIEWPTVYKCAFNKVFLKLPKKCIKIIIQNFQKHFILKNKYNKICKYFLIVCNSNTKNFKNIIQEYEKSIFYILSEIKIFFKKDKKTTLYKKKKLLKNIIYHNKLGNQLQRIKRIKKISIDISNIIKCNKYLLKRSLSLFKIDLTTKIVKKFPILQGIIGKYYAIYDGENKKVAKSILEHYLPKFFNDKLPFLKISIIISIADKLEIIIGIWNIGFKPKNNKDPFKIKRNIIGLLQILIEKKLLLSIPMLIKQTINSFKKNNIFKNQYMNIYNFIYKKLNKLLLKYNFKKNEIKSIISKKPKIIGDIIYKLKTLKIINFSIKYNNLFISNKRIINILKKFNKNIYINKKYLKKKYEIYIYNKIIKTQKLININIKKKKYINIFNKLLIFNKYIEKFFKKIKINSKNINYKNNRKAILKNIYNMLNKIINLNFLKKN